MADKKRGWIKLYRSILEHELWKKRPFSMGQAWIDLLLTANHQEEKILNQGKTEIIERGHLLTSQLQLSERWGWDRKKVREFLAILQTEDMIKFETDTKTTNITILNYNQFQETLPINSPHNSPPNSPSKPENLPTYNDSKKNENQETLPNKSEKTPHIIPHQTPHKQEVKEVKEVKNNTIPAEGGLKAPLKQPRPLTAIQQIIEHFKRIKGYDGDPGWDKVYFARHTRPAKELLDYWGSLELARKCLDWMAKQDYTWTLETAVRKAADFRIILERERAHAKQEIGFI